MGLIERDKEPRLVLVFDLEDFLTAVGGLARANPAEFPDPVVDVNDEVSVIVLAQTADLLARLQLAREAVAAASALILIPAEDLCVAQDRELRIGNRETSAQGPDDRHEKAVFPGILEDQFGETFLLPV